MKSFYFAIALPRSSLSKVHWTFDGLLAASLGSARPNQALRKHPVDAFSDGVRWRVGYLGHKKRLHARLSLNENECPA